MWEEFYVTLTERVPACTFDSLKSPNTNFKVVDSRLELKVSKGFRY